MAARQRRADGEASRERILDAATEIAAERGYDGTTIALVSTRCGLPASSIYWHFADKDALLAGVVERSFGAWLGAVSFNLTPGTGHATTTEERFRAVAAQIAKALLESPDFLRLGLMLALERRPVETSARGIFVQARHTTRAQMAVALTAMSPGADPEAVDLLTTYAMAAADGMFIAHEVDGDAVDLVRLFELHACALLDAAVRLGLEVPA